MNELLRRGDAETRGYIPLIIGHRGASAVAPENTLAAFQHAFVDGADGIEFDVQLALDGVAVVIHDTTLRRTGLRNGAIATLSSSELAQIDVGTWFNGRHPSAAQPIYTNERIPTLAQVFELTKERSAPLYVEMKCAVHECTALAAEVSRLVREYSLVDSAVVESFTLAAIAAVKQVAPEIRTAALFEPKISRPLPLARKLVEEAIRYGADEIALHRTLATRRVVETARSHDLKTVVWTVDNIAWVKRARDYGIHALITNKPAQMRARLSRLLAD